MPYTIEIAIVQTAKQNGVVFIKSSRMRATKPHDSKRSDPLSFLLEKFNPTPMKRLHFALNVSPSFFLFIRHSLHDFILFACSCHLSLRLWPKMAFLVRPSELTTQLLNRNPLGPVHARRRPLHGSLLVSIACCQSE